MSKNTDDQTSNASSQAMTDLIEGINSMIVENRLNGKFDAMFEHLGHTCDHSCSHQTESAPDDSQDGGEVSAVSAYRRSAR
jgi:hypothetical protein